MTKVAKIHRSTFKKLIHEAHNGETHSVIFNAKSMRVLLVAGERSTEIIPGNWWFVLDDDSLSHPHCDDKEDDDTYRGSAVVRYEIQIVPDEEQEDVPA